MLLLHYYITSLLHYHIFLKSLSLSTSFASRFRHPVKLSKLSARVSRLAVLPHKKISDYARSGRPHNLSDDDQTKMIEHADENPSMSAHHGAQSHKYEMVHTTLKKEGISFTKFLCCTNGSWKITLHITITATGFLKNLPRCQNNDYIVFRRSVVLFVEVNSQNYGIWLTNNPHIFEEISLHPVKVGVWCTISKHRVVAPIFLKKL